MNRVQTATQKHYRVKNPGQKPNWLHEPPTGPASAPGAPRRARVGVMASPAPYRGRAARPYRSLWLPCRRPQRPCRRPQRPCRSLMPRAPARPAALARSPSTRLPARPAYLRLPPACASRALQAHLRAPAPLPSAVSWRQWSYRGLVGHCIATQSSLS